MVHSSRRLILAALSLVAALAATAQAALASDPVAAHAVNPMRLPTGVAPLRYRLRIDPDIDRQVFHGTVEIDIDVALPTEAITLNQAELSFKSATLTDSGQTARVTLDTNRQEATLHFAKPVSAGRHMLKIAYAGKITEEGRGLYLNKYVADGAPHRMLVTQFEAIDARRMFPCWDEPDAKAVFELTAVLPRAMLAISNTPIARQTDLPGGRVEVSFQPTPRMSSYLLVLVAGDLERISQSEAGVDIGVVVPKGLAAKGQWALASLARLLPYYNDYYGVSYPLPKLDLIAVPGNYTAGAMENWGGITFIDALILLDPTASSEETRELIFVVIAHEVAHQWTGDLVTMRWWDDLWLNEAFAEWMNFHVADALNPDWHIFARGPGLLGLDRAISRDAGRASHPIYREVTDNSETDTIFDSITYQKGAAVLRMIEMWLGPDVFRDGMRLYFKAHAYANAERADLWRALSAASGKSVQSVAEGFITQAGLPDVAVSETCTDGKLAVSLTQGRFVIHYPDAPNTRWTVPVEIGRVGEAPQTLLLGSDPVRIEFAGCDHPAKVNWGVVGYYHVTYDAAALDKLGASFATFAPADRASLLTDAWLSVEAGTLDAAAWFDLTKRIGHDDAAATWGTVLDALNQTDRLLRDSPIRGSFRAYAVALLQPQLARLGWVAQPSEPPELGDLRNHVIAALGRYGDAAVVTEAQRRFAAYPADPNAMPGSIADAITTVVGIHADRPTFDRLHALAVAAPDFESKSRYFRALGSVSDPALVEAALAVALTDEYPTARLGRYLAGIAHQGEHPDLVWDFILVNGDKLYAKLPDSIRPSLGPDIASGFDDAARIAELEAYKPAASSSGGRINIAQAADDIGTKAELKARLTPEVGHWLKAPDEAH